MINREQFFASVRKAPFGGKLSQSQVAGMSAILDEWDKRGLTDVRWLAYMLATTFHETARTMQPIREIGRGKGHKYGTTYYGRGFVQLTWDYNYRKASTVVGVDLVAHPDRALELPIASAIMFDGMIRGWFTGKKLADYIHGSTADYKEARRIINGTDRAALIAGYADKFESAFVLANLAGPPPAPPTESPTMPQTIRVPIPPIVSSSAATAMASSPIGAILSRVLHREDVPITDANVPATVGKVMTAIGAAMDTGKVAVVNVKSGWLSKIVLLNGGFLATAAGWFGFNLPQTPEEWIQAIVSVVVPALTIVLRNWFTSSVTSASMVPPLTRE